MASSNSSRPAPVRAEMKSAWGSEACNRRNSSGAEQVALVVDVHARHLGGLDLGQHAAHGGHVPLAFGAGGVDHVQHQIRLGDFFERRAKGRDQRVRQPIDEANGVGHQQFASIGQAHPPHERIQRHKQRVGGFGSLAGQQIEERRLAGVGVADQRHRRHRLLLPPLAQLRAPASHFVDGLADVVNAGADPAPVGFKFGFTGPARADTAAQPRQREAGPGQPRQQVLELGEFDLPLAFARLRTPREDVENQLRPVDGLEAR